MASGIRVFGLQAMIRQLKAFGEGLEDEKEVVYGTAVRYAPFVNFGTRYMAARPYFDLATRRVRITRELAGRMFDAALSRDDNSADELADEILEEIEAAIREMELIESGNLLSSHAKGRDVAAMLRASRAKMLRPETAILGIG